MANNLATAHSAQSAQSTTITPSITTPTGLTLTTPAEQALYRQIMDLLAHEAYINLSRSAEQHAADEPGDEGALTRKWFGFTIDTKQQLLACDAERIATERALRAAQEAKLVAEIREDEYALTLAETTIAHLDAALEALDDRVGGIATDWEARVDALRDELTQGEATRLFVHYSALVERMPFSVWHPSVPDSLRRWMRQQLARTKHPLSRLYLYLHVRECVFHQYQNGGPVEDTRPIHAIEQIGLPRTKREARDEACMASQFCHENGDRRVARDTALTRLHAERLAAVKRGRGFADHVDFNDEDYHGLPVLAALTPVKVEYCNECAFPIIDFIQERTQDQHGESGFRYVRACQCPDGTDLLSELRTTRAELVYALQLSQLRERVRRRRAADVPAAQESA